MYKLKWTFSNVNYIQAVILTTVALLIMMRMDNRDENGFRQQSWSCSVSCPPVAVPLLPPSTRKSSGKLCYLIWASCAMYAVSRD